MPDCDAPWPAADHEPENTRQYVSEWYRDQMQKMRTANINHVLSIR